jgi:hypothetical protein
MLNKNTVDNCGYILSHGVDILKRYYYDGTNH